MRKRVRLDDVISPILLHDECNDSQSFQGLTNGSQRFCVRHRIIIRQGRSAQARKITAIVFCWSVSHNVTTNRRLASAVYYTAFPFSYPHGLKYCARFNAICGARYLKLTNGLKSLQERTAKTFRVIGDGLRMSQGALRSVRPYKGEITLNKVNQGIAID